MSILPDDRDTIPHGGPEMLRGCIHEAAGLASLHAQMAMAYAEIGNDAGLEFAIRNWVGYTSAALNTLGDLKALIKKGQVHGPR
jgi:hypothetical protein